jgi:ABC-type transporter Mla MlaB component
MRDAIRLPLVLDRDSVDELRPRIEHAAPGAAVVLDGSYLQRVETPGVQLLCALVLAAEGRGVVITWIRVSAVLINYVNLLGIGDVIRFDGTHRASRDSVD